MSYLLAVAELVRLIRDLLSLYRKARLEGWVGDAQAVLGKLKGAKTDEERKKIARELANLGMFPR